MNDTLIFLVLAGLALIFKWLTNQAGKDKETPPDSAPNERRTTRLPSPPSQTESEEERVRRFLEALGVPPGTQPPSPVRPRRVVKPSASAPPKVRRSWGQPLPPLVKVPPDQSPTPMPPVEEPAVVRQDTPTLSMPPPLPSSVVEVSSPAPVAGPATSRRAAPAGSLKSVLRSRATLRQAILLREVLGPPRGLQPLAEFHGV